MPVSSAVSHRDDSNIPKEIYNWRVYFAAMAATFTAVMIGCVFFASPVVYWQTLLSSSSSTFSAQVWCHIYRHISFPSVIQVRIWTWYKINSRVGPPFREYRFMFPGRRLLWRYWWLSFRILLGKEVGFDILCCSFLLGFSIGMRSIVSCSHWGLVPFIQMHATCSHKTGLGIMYAGRVIVGLGVGVGSNIAASLLSLQVLVSYWPFSQPIYVAEIAPARIRGRLIGFYELCWQIGGVVGMFFTICQAMTLLFS